MCRQPKLSLRNCGIKLTKFIVIIRLPDIVLVGGHRFYRDLPFFQLRSKLAERNSTKTSHVLGSKCDLKMYVRNLGYTLPLEIRGPKTPFFDDFAT